MMTADNDKLANNCTITRKVLCFGPESYICGGMLFESKLSSNSYFV